MKEISKYLIYSAIFVMAFIACEEDALDPLSGKYPAPAENALSDILEKTSLKEGALRVFTLKISNGGVTATYDPGTSTYSYSGTGNLLSVDFVGKTYFLESGVYTVAPKQTAKAGNFVAGYDEVSEGQKGTFWYTVNNGSETGTKVKGGTITVEKLENNYNISGSLILADDTYIRIDYSGEIVYEEDPPVYTYTSEITKPYVWTADGSTFTPVDGSQLNKITVFADGITCAVFEIVTAENASTLAGEYPVVAARNTGEINQGQYLNFLWYGMFDLAVKSGSFVVDGTDTLYIREGDITVTDNEGILSITSNNLKFQDISTQAAFGVLTETGALKINNATNTDGGGDGITLANVISATAMDLSAYGGSGFTVTVKLATAGITTEPDGTGGFTYSGNGNYISIDFKRDAGTLPSGTYNIISNETAANDDAIAGYPALFGTGFWGSVWGSVTEGEAADLPITGGTVEVTENSGNYTIIANCTTESGDITATYNGPLTIQ